jgi:DNA-binding NarL/FixJ family response regulator
MTGDPLPMMTPPPSRPGSIRLVVVDDQPLLRTGFRMILAAERDMTVVGEAGDGVEAVREVARLQPDVVLMDIRMPNMDGVEATRRITAAAGPDGPRVLILTTFNLDEYVLAAIRAGASGFLLKDVPPEELAAAIRIVASGDALLAPSVTRRLLDRFAELPSPNGTPVRQPSGMADLTERELEVFTLIGRGLSNQEIAERLFLGETTVKTHVSRDFAKLDLRDRVQAVVLAYEAGIVRAGHPEG